MKRAIAPVTAAIAWTAVLVQMVYSVLNALAIGDSFLMGLVDYFSYFTVLTNTLVALVLTVPTDRDVLPGMPCDQTRGHHPAAHVE